MLMLFTMKYIVKGYIEKNGRRRKERRDDKNYDDIRKNEEISGDDKFKLDLSKCGENCCRIWSANPYSKLTWKVI